MSNLFKLIQYIILAAGEEEYGQNDLGPIHIIKYLYLGDMFHAQKNNGKTFTGVTWKFHHFGPWSVEAWQSIDEAAMSIGADVREFEDSRFDSNYKRYCLSNSRKFEELNDSLPLNIVGQLRATIRKYGRATPDLLDMVYKTPPMINAAPEEVLIFEPLITTSPVCSSTSTRADLSKTAQKKRKERIESLKAEMQKKIKAAIQNDNNDSVPTPRYDEVFFQGLEEVESLSGVTDLEAGGVVSFDHEIWKSPFRTDPQDDC